RSALVEHRRADRGRRAGHPGRLRSADRGRSQAGRRDRGADGGERDMTADVDVLIVGGGLVGASLACALGRSRLRVALVEPVPVEAEQQPSYDDRTTALAPSSQRIFQALGLWPELRAE